MAYGNERQKLILLGKGFHQGFAAHCTSNVFGASLSKPHINVKFVRSVGLSVRS